MEEQLGASSLWSSRQNVKPGTIIVVPRKIELTSTIGKIEAITSSCISINAHIGRY